MLPTLESLEGLSRTVAMIHVAEVELSMLLNKQVKWETMNIVPGLLIFIRSSTDVSDQNS